MSVNLEKIDMLRERVNVSYNEAKEVLEKFDGDIVEAIIYLEKDKNFKTTKPDFSDQAKTFFERVNQWKLVVKKKDQTLINLNLVISVIFALFAFPFTLLMLALALFTGHRIKITKGDVESIDLGEMVGKAGDSLKRDEE